MGWSNMPSSVQETAFERQIKEGKAFQISREVSIPASTTQWVYVTFPSTKDLILQSRNISATAGPVRYKVYPNPVLVNPVQPANEIFSEKLNNKSPIVAQATAHLVNAADVDVSGIPPSDTKLIVAGQESGSRGTGDDVFQSFFKIYPQGLTAAVSIENAASITANVELHYLWAEDVE